MRQPQKAYQLNLKSAISRRKKLSSVHPEPVEETTRHIIPV